MSPSDMARFRLLDQRYSSADIARRTAGLGLLELGSGLARSGMSLFSTSTQHDAGADDTT